MRRAVPIRRRRTAVAAASLTLAVTAVLVGGGAGTTGALVPSAQAMEPTTTTPTATTGAAARPPRSVMFVGNNWDGTATIVDAATHRKLGTLNTIPDKAQRMAEIESNPEKLAFYLAIQQEIGEGHDQFTDDMFSTHDGRLVAVSRPSFGDVVGIDLATRKIVWRFPMEGYRADHMAESPDGTKILVSDSTANKVHELDIRTGKELRQFATGDSPHESNYSKDGSRIFHADIGRVYTPVDRSELGPVRDAAKGDRRFEILDNKTFQVLHRWDIGKRLAAAGYPGMSSAVRPMAIAPDERYAYLQVSFFHGFVEFDMAKGRVTRLAQLPDRTDGMPREQYVLDSAHHGLAINHRGTKLCAAGTMDDYAAIVNRKTFRYKILNVGQKPYWATDGPDGSECWVSVSGGDKVVVIDYRTATRVATVKVGDHPQRVRPGFVAAAIVRRWG